MAQWIPKTSWKVSNLNKRYGTPYVTQGYDFLGPEKGLETYSRLQHTVSSEAIRKGLLSVAAASSGALIIDVRGEPERRRYPLIAPGIVALHPHDILSGAAGPILPPHKEAAELFVMASETQRAVNTCTALRRWGYPNVAAVEVDAVRQALGEMRSGEDEQKEAVEDR